MNIVVDDQHISLDSTQWQTFDQFAACATQLMPEGRVIRTISIDGDEVNCTVPPSENHLRSAQEIVIRTCLYEDLVKVALEYQRELAGQLSREVLQLSTDCLIDLPQQTFSRWNHALNSIKTLIRFIPQFLSFQVLTHPDLPDSFEDALLERITRIQNAVEATRKALEAQDIVLFSDTLELQFIPWLKEHEGIANQHLENYKQAHQTNRS